MSVEIARRLLEGGLVGRPDVEVGLLQAVIRGVPFVQAFVEQRAGLEALLQRVLERSNFPTIRKVHAAAKLCAGLPVGMCERLLAVPVRQEAITKTVDIAAVDPFDAHVRQEFSFHLDAPVRILRAPLREVLAALDGLHTGGAFVPSVHEMLGLAADERDSNPPGPGAAVAATPDAPLPRLPSQPPIPLVRRHGPRLGATTAHGLGSAPPPAPAEQDERGEPVIGLTRPKTLSSEALTRSRLAEADLAQVEKQLAGASSPDEVVQLIVEHACPEGSSIVFSVKSTEFVARAASFEVNGLRDVALARARPSVLQAAVDSGHYLGTLPETLVHALLRALLADRLGAEVYVVPASIGQRPTLMLFVTGFERSFTATRRADRIAAAAGAALERLLLERKR